MPSYWINSLPLQSAGHAGCGEILVRPNGNILVCGHLGSANSPTSTVYEYSPNGELQKSVSTLGFRINSAYLETDDTLMIGSTSANSSFAGLLHKLSSDLSSGVSPPAKTTGLTSGTYRATIQSIIKVGTDYIIGYGASTQLMGVAKYDSSFSNTFLWSWTPTDAGAGSGAVTDTSGNIYYHAATSITAVDRCTLTKLNSSGIEQWTRSLTPSSGGVPTYSAGNYIPNVCIDSSDNLYVTGLSENNTRVFLASYNTSGVIRWQRQLVVSAIVNRPVSITTDGTNVYLAFWSTATAFNIVKYNSSGTLQWQRSITLSVSPGGTHYLNVNTFIKSCDNGDSLLVYFSTLSVGGANGRCTLAKLPSDGSLTGTYLGYVYAASSLTEQAGTLTDASHTMTLGGAAYSTSASDLSVRINGGNTSVS